MHKLLPRPEYYEAKLQLRPRHPQIEQFIVANINKRNDAAITKVEVIKTGIDFYISSQRYARALGTSIKRKFKGKLVVSKQIFGRNRNSSKVLYRATVLFRPEDPNQEPE